MKSILRKNVNFKVAILGVAIFMSGCASQTFVISGNTDKAPTQQSAQPFFVYGVGQERVVDAAQVCGGAEKVLKVESQETFPNILLRVITFGIYTPRDSKVYCK
jgi:hypothetical protein